MFTASCSSGRRGGSKSSRRPTSPPRPPSPISHPSPGRGGSSRSEGGGSGGVPLSRQPVNGSGRRGQLPQRRGGQLGDAAELVRSQVLVRSVAAVVVHFQGGAEVDPSREEAGLGA